MKVTIGIGQNLSFYVLRRDKQSMFRNVFKVNRITEPEMFLWLTQYLLDHNKDPFTEHKWYEIEL